MVFIIIPVFNRIDFTLRCLQSIVDQSYKNYKVIIIDDGSSDGSAEKIKAGFPQFTVLKGDGHYYWTKCVNTGLLSIQNEMTADDFVLHVNNDIEFEPSYIDNLLQFHAKHPQSIVGSLSYDPGSKRVSHLGIFYNPWLPLVKKNFSEEEIELTRLQHIEYLKSDTISARGLLIPGYVIQKIGLLDEQNFPQYRSDEDYALRCRKAGINVYIATSCLVYNSRINTGYDHTIHRITWSSFYKSLFSILSTNNLAIRWNWAKKNARMPLLYFPADASLLFLGFFKSIVYRKILRKPLN